MGAKDTPPVLQPEEAIGYFRAKGYEVGFDWRDVWQEEHARAFTVAKAMSVDLLQDIRSAVDEAIATGQSLAQFRKNLTPMLVIRGWWGKQLQVDPLTGEEKLVQLGSPRRLRTIYNTNMRTAHAAGRWERIQRNKKVFPFLRYVSVMDGRERPEHGAWHGTVLPIDDPWWDTHYPPCGWNCRCTAVPMNQRMLDRRGYEVNQPQRFPEKEYVNKRTGEVTRLERGIDPGWSYNVGQAAMDGNAPPPISGVTDEPSANSVLLSESDYKPLSGFFRTFGIDDQAAARRGKVWRDPTGWPIVISGALFRDAAGRPSNIFPSRTVGVIVAKALADPGRTSWIWVRAQNGDPILMHRYQSAGVTVDIGRAGWRWKVDEELAIAAIQGGDREAA